MTEPTLVITGMGVVSPVGIGLQTHWQKILEGKSGIRRITSFDASDLPVQIAAEVKNFDPSVYLPRKIAHSTSPFMQYALVAAEEALRDAQFDPAQEATRTGIVMGTAMGGAKTIAETQEKFCLAQHKKVSPHFVPLLLNNMAAAHLAIMHGIQGPALTLNTACSAGGDAILTAAMLLRADAADAVLVMGGECILSPVILSSLAQAKALSRQNANPTGACRPFDRCRDGFVIGEGGGALVLEKEAHALARKAEIKARLAGYACTIDAYHITAPDPEGKGVAECMSLALHKAYLQPADIGYINAHGTATVLGDVAETLAIKKVFGDVHSAPPVSSTKAATGHMMGAGGITEVINCVQSIREGILPPTINYSEPDTQCDLDYIPNVPRKSKISAAMSNSMGFGGQNSSLIVTRYPF